MLSGRPARRALIWLGVAAVVALALYRLKFAPVPVEAAVAVTDTIVAEVMGTGTLEARLKTTLSPRIQERLAEVLVDQGDAVRAGQLLARLDDGELRQQVAVAEAALAAARAARDRTRTDEARALAVLEQARLTHERGLALLATRVAAQADVDKAVEALHIAEADLRRARAAITEAEKQVITAERHLAWQRERLGFTLLTSPYDGLVVRRDRDPGGVVVPGASILQLIATNELWVSAWVDETAMTALAPGQPARVVFRSEPERSYPGEVARLGREADRETREFVVDVRVRQLPSHWAVGQRAEVFIQTGRRAQATVIPARMLVWREGRAGVFVESGGRARWRAVQPGVQGESRIEIAAGLQPGERVVAPLGQPARPLRDGQRVIVQSPAGLPGPADPALPQQSAPAA
jgi:HlyD family secretion protein